MTLFRTTNAYLHVSDVLGGEALVQLSALVEVVLAGVGREEPAALLQVLFVVQPLAVDEAGVA